MPTKQFNFIRARKVEWRMEIDLKCEPHAETPSLACSAGQVHLVDSSLGSSCSSRQGLSRVPKMMTIVPRKLKLRPVQF